MDTKEKIKELIDRLRDEVEACGELNVHSSHGMLEIADEIGVLVDQL